MQEGKRRRGPQSAIGRRLWPDLQRLAREGQTLERLAEWLRAEHGIECSQATVSRTLAKIREETPEPPEPDIELTPDPEPADDEDELSSLRRHFRRQTYSRSYSARDQQGAARLVVAIMKEQRERREPKPAQVGQPPAETWTPPTFGVKGPN